MLSGDGSRAGQREDRTPMNTLHVLQWVVTISLHVSIWGFRKNMIFGQKTNWTHAVEDGTPNSYIYIYISLDDWDTASWSIVGFEQG